MANTNLTNRPYAQPDQQPPRNWQEAFWQTFWPRSRRLRIIILIAFGLLAAIYMVWKVFPESKKEQVWNSIFSKNSPPPKSSPPEDIGRPSQYGAKGGGETKPRKVQTIFKNPSSMLGKLIVKTKNGVAVFSTEVEPGAEKTILLPPGDYTYDYDIDTSGMTLRAGKPCYTFKRNESGKFTVKEGTQKSIDLPILGFVKIPDCNSKLQPTSRE